MELGFNGGAVELYHRYRRRYPASVVKTLANAFGLTGDDLVVDLGCGTGQLTVPLARRVRAAIGVDPDPDMLRQARLAGVENITWMLGADADLPALTTLLGKGSVAAVTVGQALHLVDRDRLLPAVAALARVGGGIAVITNGRSLWQYDTAWSAALRAALATWLSAEPPAPDEELQEVYSQSLVHAGFDVDARSVGYTEELDLEHLVGGVLSTLPAEQLPPPYQRATFAEHLRQAVEPHAPYRDQVHVQILAGLVH